MGETCTHRAVKSDDGESEDLQLKGGNVPIQRAAYRRPLEPVVYAYHFCRPVRSHRRRSCHDQARSKRSRFITLFHAATKSCTNFSWESSEA
jgi:hypothetical protein